MYKRGLISWLKCSECGEWFPIPRRESEKRKRGHIKDLWCVKCKKITPHIEYIEKYNLDENNISEAN